MIFKCCDIISIAIYGGAAVQITIFTQKQFLVCEDNKRIDVN
jgi:hypothetical protein